MKPEINFYQTDEAVARSLAPLLLKVLEEGKRVLVFCEDNQQIKDIDSALWSYGRHKFIPHATIFDKEFSFERQPVLITNKEENLNKADYLVFFDEVSHDFLATFPRIFHFFEMHEATKARGLAKKLKNADATINYYKKEEGKWAKL